MLQAVAYSLRFLFSRRLRLHRDAHTLALPVCERVLDDSFKSRYSKDLVRVDSNGMLHCCHVCITTIFIQIARVYRRHTAATATRLIRAEPG